MQGRLTELEAALAEQKQRYDDLIIKWHKKTREYTLLEERTQSQEDQIHSMDKMVNALNQTLAAKKAEEESIQQGREELQKSKKKNNQLCEYIQKLETELVNVTQKQDEANFQYRKETDRKIESLTGELKISQEENESLKLKIQQEFNPKIQELMKKLALSGNANDNFKRKIEEVKAQNKSIITEFQTLKKSYDKLVAENNQLKEKYTELVEVKERISNDIITQNRTIKKLENKNASSKRKSEKLPTVLKDILKRMNVSSEMDTRAKVIQNEIRSACEKFQSLPTYGGAKQKECRQNFLRYKENYEISLHTIINTEFQLHTYIAALLAKMYSVKNDLQRVTFLTDAVQDIKQIKEYSQSLLNESISAYNILDNLANGTFLDPQISRTSTIRAFNRKIYEAYLYSKEEPIYLNKIGSLFKDYDEIYFSDGMTENRIDAYIKMYCRGFI